ncbi:ABC transporter permease [Amycolatopsis alkalitolerans]|uniref:ABC transporter permease n=1 Tax=Amycolatopsis alkalitolerans TaxID=2547244 RepID=A0A5C4LUZ8_9PSEU|nr:ABC transporter permease [Amycolatopsis alkalitolerans]TNC21814.1 ABC transporter permease [Amycolatopsis alkalitolerans]
MRQALSRGPVQLATVLAVYAVGMLVVPGFADPSSVRAMLVIASFLGIAAIGQTFVILIGGIDLSVPALIGAGNVLAARLAGQGIASPVVILVVLGLGAVAGAVNGLVTGLWRLPPLVVTLATGSVVGGLILLWTNATLTGSAPAWLTGFTSAASGVGPVPLAPVVLTWLVLAAAAQVFLLRTRPGRQIQMLGANREAARLMLVGERRVTTLCFAVSGALAALSGLLLTGFTGAGLFTVGDPYLFQSIAAVVIGGTSLLGGRGGAGRTVLGSMTLVALTTLLIGLSLTSAAQQAVLGAVIVAVTALYGRDRTVADRI